MKVVFIHWVTGQRIVGVLEGTIVDEDGRLRYWVRELNRDGSYSSDNTLYEL